MCNTLENIITTVFLSLANSANVLVGKEIGRDRKDRAYQNALAITCWTPVIAAVFAGAMLVLRGPITAMFHQTSQVTSLAMKLILIMALTLPLRFLQYIHICGILRSGADGKKAAFYDFWGSGASASRWPFWAWRWTHPVSCGSIWRWCCRTAW